MAVLFYDNGILMMAKANVNVISTVNICLTNSEANQSNTLFTDIAVSTNTSAARLGNPAVSLVNGNVQWSGDMVTFTATGDAYAANAVFYADVGPKYLIAHYVLSNANY